MCEKKEHNSADQDERHIRQDQQRVAEPPKREKEQREHEKERRRNDEPQAGVGAGLVFELSFPGDVISRRQVRLDGFVNTALCLGDKAAHVAAPDSALEGNSAAVLIAFDLARPFLRLHLRKLTEL